MDYYPIYLDLRGKHVLVAGGGNVALRKTRGVLDAGARVTVVAPRCLPEFQSLPVELVQRAFKAADLEGICLAFTATNDRDVNRRVAEEARRRGVPVNVADAPGECDFIVPARLEREGVQIAISTGGKDPSLAARMRRRLEELLGP